MQQHVRLAVVEVGSGYEKAGRDRTNDPMRQLLHGEHSVFNTNDNTEVE
jgi:hypothetical protein